VKELIFEKKLVGDKISIFLYDIDETIAYSLIEELYEEAKRLEKIFNFYDKDSELSILNQKRELRVSNELLEVISKSITYSKLSSGMYDISLGKNFLERKSNIPLSKLSCSYKDIHINKNSITLNHPDILIDLGSIAKGYIVDKLLVFLKERGVEKAFIDARGDMKSLGNEETIYIQHPRDKTKALFPIAMKGKAIATSGDYNQFHNNYENSHILNQKDIISATIIANTALEADAFASILFVTDKKQREQIIKQNLQIKALLIDKDLNQFSYNGFENLKIIEVKNK